MIKRNIKRLSKETLIVNKDKFNLELKNNFDLLPMDDIQDVQVEFNRIQQSISKASSTIKQTKNKYKKLTETTIKLIEDRLNTNINSVEYRSIDKQVKRNIRRDVRKYNTKIFQITLDRNRSLKTAKQGTSVGTFWITCLKDETGEKHQSREKVLNICTNFYKRLYSDSHQQPSNDISYSCPDTIQPITGLEVQKVLTQMKYNRAPGEDGITTESLKIGERVLLPHITNFFNTILTSGEFPDRFCHSDIILLHKKGDKTNINNYRPISLISHLYKAFIKVIEYRISGLLDLEQPAEQAGFRRGLSTTDHLQALNQLIEKFNESNKSLYLAFVDYTKAFDSITHLAMFNALKNQHIDPTYINLIRKIYNNSTAAIKIHSSGPSFTIAKGVKQGDPLSPKLFTSTLEDVFRKLAVGWEGKGIDVGGVRLTNLRFADDIVLFSSSASELQTMLQELSIASLDIGLRMNRTKTKVMTNSVETRITVDEEQLAYVQEYIYLGQIVSFGSRQENEITRRIENAWRSFWSMGDLMKGDLPLSLKRKLMDVCILPVLTYGAQTWSLTNIQKHRLKVCQRAMERSILGVKRIDRIRNTELRSKTQIADVAMKAAKLKWDWAGHVCRMSGDQWAKLTTEWSPDTTQRRRGRPRTRWRDDLVKFRADWTTLAQERKEWREWGEAFAQQWDIEGS